MKRINDFILIKSYNWNFVVVRNHHEEMIIMMINAIS
jgi:hypothetical protein